MPASVSTRSESSLLVGFYDPRQHQLSKHVIVVGRVGEAERVVGAAQRVPPMPAREEMISSGRHPVAEAITSPRSRSSTVFPAASRCAAAAFSAASSASSCAEPTCSMSREPRRDECTICTAVAPQRGPRRMHMGHGPTRYGQRLVRRFSLPGRLQPPRHGTALSRSRDLEPS
jgi:hypothetical protein